MTPQEFTRIIDTVRSSTKDSFGKETQLAGSIPEKQLRNAIKSFAPAAAGETILAFTNTTLFNSGKTGFIYTPDYIYSENFKYNNPKHPRGMCVPVARLVNVEKAKDGLNITYRDGTRVYVFTSAYTQFLTDIFTRIARANVAEEEAQANAAAKAKAEAEAREKATALIEERARAEKEARAKAEAEACEKAKAGIEAMARAVEKANEKAESGAKAETPQETPEEDAKKKALIAEIDALLRAKK